MPSYLKVPQICGLYLITGVFSQEKHDEYNKLLKIENGHMCRQIHPATEYGWKFLPLRDDNNLIIPRTIKSYLGDFPILIKEIWEHISSLLSNISDLPESLKTCVEANVFPDHLLINKYNSGDGCIPHVDELEFWQDWVVGVSFGSGCIFNFVRAGEKISVYIPPNSIYILTKDARYKWKHGIPFVTEEVVNNNIVKRGTRISLTFRNIDKKWLSDEVRMMAKLQ